MTDRLVDIDDDRATDPAVVGAKAASLAVARASGLPVLGGVVVAIGEESAAVALGTSLLAERGSGAARLAVAAHPLDGALVAELVAAGSSLGPSLVVRSSASREAETVWAGAFASYADIAPHELPKAVGGCWASMFTEDALARGRARGVAPGGLAMAVLIQPEIKPGYGGVATVAPAGTVVVVGREGSPAPIVAGWEPGETVTIDVDGGIGGPGGAAVLQPALAGAVADLTRKTLWETGFDHIEWAEDGAALWLLQAGRAASSGLPAEAAAAPPPVTVDPRLEVVVGNIAEFPGPIGEALVLPWAIGSSRLPTPAVPPDDQDTGRLWAAARRIAEELTIERWQDPARAEAVLAALRASDSGALDGIAGTDAIDDERGARVLGLLERLATALAERGAIAKPAALAHLTIDEVESLCAGGATMQPRRLGRGRWEPFLGGAVSALGVTVGGNGVVPGGGAGRLRLIRSPGDAALFRPREIVAAVYPINNLAPLLWEAAAVVTVGGGRGAHLFEVAAALGVPAVCGADIERAIEAPLVAVADGSFLGAVDGSSGSVAVLGTA